MSKIPNYTNDLSSRHSTVKEEAAKGTSAAEPEISPIKEPAAATPIEVLAGSSKALRKHHSADRILLPLSQENLERRKQEKRRRHHSTAAAVGDRRWEKSLALESYVDFVIIQHIRFTV